MQYTTIQSEPLSEAAQRIRAVFKDIEKKARLSGNTNLMMSLDRIPCLILGAQHNTESSSIDGANTQAILALERITESMANDGADSGGYEHN